MKKAFALKSILAIVSICLSTICITAQAATRTWDGEASDEDWFNPVNWDLDTLPAAGDDVIIGAAGGSVILNSSTPMLSSIQITDNVLTFTNGSPMSIILQATNVFVRSGGKICHSANTDILPDDGWVEDGMIAIVCTNLQVDVDGHIDANKSGFRGGFNYDVLSAHDPGKGPGKSNGTNHGTGGAGHGGEGGTTINVGGISYGSILAPTNAGSGAGGTRYPSYNGGDGGGVIRIDASNEVLVNGLISADGGSGDGYAGAGSGGSVYITCRTIDGSGTISAAGGIGRGNGVNNPNRSAGGGGGGRVSIVYNSTAQGLVSPAPSIAFDVSGGVLTAPSTQYYFRSGRARPGSLYMPDTTFIDLSNVLGGQIYVPGFVSYTTNNWTLSSGGIGFPDGFTLNVTGDLLITGNGAIEMSNSVLSVDGNLTISSTGPGACILQGGPSSATSIGGDLAITNGWVELDHKDSSSTQMDIPGNLLQDSGGFYLTGHEDGSSSLNVGGVWTIANTCNTYLNAGLTTDFVTDPGLDINVGGMLSIAPNCWIYPQSHYTNGGSVWIQVDSLIVSEGGGINADASGFAGGIYEFVGYNGYGFGPGTTIGSTYGGGGAGYGGAGGHGPRETPETPGGPIYGDANAPVYPGSGAGLVQNRASGASYGGGLVYIKAAGDVTIDGMLTVNGGQVGYWHGGGSGGGIYINCDRFIGSSTGLLSAEGADGTKADRNLSGGGGGGGGRIMVYHRKPITNWQGTCSVTGGLSGDKLTYTTYITEGEDGTVVFLLQPPTGTLIILK